jgi:RHS repeat-associated protein
LPSGLVTTNIYDGNGWLITTCDYAIENGSTVYFRTNSYTYSKGLVHTHTDERGLTIINTWDALQRLRRVDYPDGTFITNLYNNLDLCKVVDRMSHVDAYGYDSMRRLTAWTNADGAVTRYNYCTCGSLESTLDALNHPTLYNYDNFGRMTDVVYPDGYSVTNIYNLLGQLVSVQDSAGANTTNWYNNQGLRYAISNAFGQVSALAFDINDRVINSVDANGVSVSMTYDSLGRLFTRAYPDGGVESFGYSPRGLVAYTNQLNQVTRYGYDAARRKTAETNANLEITRFSYSAASDLLTLIDGKNQVTTWNYDSYGRVTNKVDATGNPMFVYGYDPDNRLTNRWSAAKGGTTYGYDPVGNLTTVIYQHSHSIHLSYDPLNRLTNMVDAVGATHYGYDTASQLLSEGGLWPNDTVSYTYNGRLRNSLSLQQPNASAWTESYSYAAGSRLTGITSPPGAFGYQYVSGIQNLVSSITLPNSAYIYDTYDNVTRLTGTFLMNGQGYYLNAHSYVNNVGNQRVQQTFTAGDYVNYTYDNIGQLKTATGNESGGTHRLNEQFGYKYDAAHNLNYRTNNALIQTFNVNSLNELTAAGRSGTLTVAGTTTSPATNVTVNGLNAFLYYDSTFAKDGFTLTNGNNSFTASAKDNLGRQDTATITAFLPATVNYTYDPNGNLLSDGNRCFAYDDENELISVWVTNVWRSDFAYDGKWRRRMEKDYSWSSSAWTQTNEVHYVYDGNLVIQERNTNNVPQVTYTRGKDLSGSLQGAGGIGGLLALSQNTATNTQHFYYHADGNGNITCLINSNQVVVARYLYDPFGNTLSASGSMADANHYRFSSKEYHPNSGLVYYLYRFYDPNLQRWVNRDPLYDIVFFQQISKSLSRGQKVNLYKEALRNPYEFVHNEEINELDPYGLKGYWGCVLKVLACEGLSIGCPATAVAAVAGCIALCAESGGTVCACCWLAIPAAVGTVCYEAVKCWQEAAAEGCLP